MRHGEHRSSLLFLGAAFCSAAFMNCTDGGFKVREGIKAQFSELPSGSVEPPLTVATPSPIAVATPPAVAVATPPVMTPAPPMPEPDPHSPQQIAGDATSTWLTTPSFPLTKALPKNPSAILGDGLSLAADATNAFSLVMGSGQMGANRVTSQSIRDTFFLNYMAGDQTKTIGNPIDGLNSIYNAVARHYAVGDPNDIHVMQSDGMHLRAICSKNRQDCSNGKVWGAMVRLPFEWRPGSTLKVGFKSPVGDHSWVPIWLFQGSQISPGPGGDPYAGYGTPSTPLRVSNALTEIDWNDNFTRSGQGVPAGFQVDYGTPDTYGTKWKVAPHNVYWANSNGYVFHPNAGPDFLQLPFSHAIGFHTLVGNWRGDGSNLLDLFIDGKLVVTSYMEYPVDTYVNPADGKTKTVAMHLMIGNQAIPTFSPGAATATDNDGIVDGWTMVVQEISGWNGNVANPDSYRAGTNALS